MSWMSVHYECCSSGGGDATEANQLAILAAIAAVQACCDANQVDITDIQTGVDNIEASTVKPHIC